LALTRTSQNQQTDNLAHEILAHHKIIIGQAPFLELEKVYAS